MPTPQKKAQARLSSLYLEGSFGFSRLPDIRPEAKFENLPVQQSGSTTTHADLLWPAGGCLDIDGGISAECRTDRVGFIEHVKGGSTAARTMVAHLPGPLFLICDCRSESRWGLRHICAIPALTLILPIAYPPPRSGFFLPAYRNRGIWPSLFEPLTVYFCDGSPLWAAVSPHPHCQVRDACPALTRRGFSRVAPIGQLARQASALPLQNTIGATRSNSTFEGIAPTKKTERFGLLHAWMRA